MMGVKILGAVVRITLKKGHTTLAKELMVAKCKVCLGKMVRSILSFGGKQLLDEPNEYRMSHSFSDDDNIICIIIYHVFMTVPNIC